MVDLVDGRRTAMEDHRKEYGATVWRHLPSDKTMNEFRTGYQKRTGRGRKPSDDWLRNALQKLDPDETPGSIYEDLFAKRLVPGEKNEVEDTTSPRLIAWEVAELLFVILQTREEKKLEGEEYASAVLDQLVEQLIASVGEELPKGFVDTQYLTNPNIRHKLLYRFEEQFKQRLDIIQNAIFGEVVDVDTLKTTLERLDIIIAELQQKPSAPLCSNRDALRTLYQELLSQRQKLLPPNARKDGDLELFQWALDEKNDLVDQLKSQILHTKREPSEAEVQDFLNSYQIYLSALIPVEVKQEVQSFWQQYTQLHQYFYGDHDAEEFEKNVRKELCDFARDLFVDLTNQDNIPYSYSYYVPSRAVSAYARSKLADIHRDIQIGIHQPLRMLRSVYAYFYYTAGRAIVSEDCIQKQIHVTGMMRDQIRVLSEGHPELSSLDPDDVSSLGPYMEGFRAHTQPVFGELPVNETIIYMGIACDPNKTPGAVFQKLLALSEMLKMECQLVVSLEVEKAVKKLTNEFIEMKKNITI